jgi:hypothetical protein
LQADELAELTRIVGASSSNLSGSGTSSNSQDSCGGGTQSTGEIIEISDSDSTPKNSGKKGLKGESTSLDKVYVTLSSESSSLSRRDITMDLCTKSS